jgi:hypothetical protein
MTSVLGDDPSLRGGAGRGEVPRAAARVGEAKTFRHYPSSSCSRPRSMSGSTRMTRRALSPRVIEHLLDLTPVYGVFLMTVVTQTTDRVCGGAGSRSRFARAERGRRG